MTASPGPPDPLLNIIRQKVMGLAGSLSDRGVKIEFIHPSGSNTVIAYREVGDRQNLFIIHIGTYDDCNDINFDEALVERWLNDDSVRCIATSPSSNEMAVFGAISKLVADEFPNLTRTFWTFEFDGYICCYYPVIWQNGHDVPITMISIGGQLVIDYIRPWLVGLAQAVHSFINIAGGPLAHNAAWGWGPKNTPPLITDDVPFGSQIKRELRLE
jgi:hypothetical protein